ncbi:MAG: two-component regulator propeller domain-containing protein [Caldilineaceae bacterium]
MARASSGLTTPLVRDIATDTRGSVWFATPVGLFQYQEGRWLSDYIAWEGADRRLNNVNELLVARDGAIWIATGGAGVRRKREEIDSYRETVYNMEQGNLPSNGVTALAEDRDGAIWAGTFAGVSRFINERWSDPVDADALPSPVVTDLLATPTDMWIGTGSGWRSMTWMP